MGRLMTVATCSLNQWALDWEGNLKRIKESIVLAKEQGATLRVGPELEVTGYGCLDHFLENDVYLHSFQMLRAILEDRTLDGIIIDLGMPIIHRNNRFNCRVLILNGKILLIRPKLYLANDGNYREMRYFIPWLRPQHIEAYYLPEMIAEVVGVRTVPIGDAVISSLDTCIGCETCEELFTPRSPHNDMGLNGVEIFTNSSGSHHALRKLDTRISLILEATRKNGGIYLYANQQGCDGDRLYYDGCAMVIVNGEIVAQGSQFSLNDVEVVTAVVDIEEVRSYRFAPARGLQSLTSPAYERIEVDFALSSSKGDFDPDVVLNRSQSLRVHAPEEEIALGPAAWLWDYLRRSKASGFLIPLSGGIDSCSTATLVFSMCRMVMDALKSGNEVVKTDVARVASWGQEDWSPKTPQELCNRLLVTVYMGMATQSSQETRDRAQHLAEAIGSYHIDMNIDDAYKAERDLLTQATGFTPKFKVYGGSNAENLALQNIQARIRMVTAYYYAQMICTVRERPGGGSLLVLGSGNVDECLRGYLTKYDCSSADINPIGSISKVDLKRFIHWATAKFDLPILQEFLDATPTAELEPITSDYVQSDEADMGMTYHELSIFGRLRKERKLGPYGMFERLLHDWRDQYTPREVADKVKRFHHFYAINRHKMTTMTPAYHAEEYSPDDNRFDLRPFLYPPFFESWSFKKIDERVEQIEKKKEKTGSK
ncbi:putative glutamine-dependent NAD(+) synthetase [Trematosphaeria pertusa]|uniref:Glutamine-dependent NAD(+) synthetase n=1 Tax=Trematosphaeria pertusa TaxID=390896 RepID=A0A6A6IDF5_9PLEO|nr:putative glutamine-dependent NAD(+) synthetase [Trematosphaeria pertusa]KAF2247922.1 putative glutamine-dependent NAD(+) synthetase [Trematosphaeria pertusa]